MSFLEERHSLRKGNFMSSKKEVILKFLDEGKNIEDIVALGYNKKYVKEVIRNANKKNIVKNTQQESQFHKEDDIERSKKNLWNILESNHWNQCKCGYENKGMNNSQTVSDLMKVLLLLQNNDQLLNRLDIEVKICIIDNKCKNDDRQKEIYDIDKLNPIEIYRDKGKDGLKNILYNYDIVILKEIARRYTPDARGYVYKWMNNEKIINYIVERAENLSDKGSVFITD